MQKAGGPNEIPIEVWKCLGDARCILVHKLF